MFAIAKHTHSGRSLYDFEVLHHEDDKLNRVVLRLKLQESSLELLNQRVKLIIGVANYERVYREPNS